MIRKSFVMSVNEGCEKEYEKRHSPIWPELEQTLKEAGVLNYSIYLDPETRLLFAYAEVESEERWAAIAETDVCRRWWASMQPLMPSNEDSSPVSRQMREVFHINNNS